jgi:hypothetical protein
MANNAYKRGLRSELPLYNEIDSNVAYLKSGYVIPLSKEDNKTPNSFSYCANCVCLEECVVASFNKYDCGRYQELQDDLQKYIYNRLYEYLSGELK